MDGCVQDASFQDEIILYTTDKDQFPFQSSLRFSNFGRMVAYTNPDEEEKKIHNDILSILKNHNFVFIPNKLLDVEYDGNNKEPGIETWWIRFFDYL